MCLGLVVCLLLSPPRAVDLTSPPPRSVDLNSPPKTVDLNTPPTPRTVDLNRAPPTRPRSARVADFSRDRIAPTDVSSRQFSSAEGAWKILLPMGREPFLVSALARPQHTVDAADSLHVSTDRWSNVARYHSLVTAHQDAEESQATHFLLLVDAKRYDGSFVEALRTAAKHTGCDSLAKPRYVSVIQYHLDAKRVAFAQAVTPDWTDLSTIALTRSDAATPPATALMNVLARFLVPKGASSRRVLIAGDHDMDILEQLPAGERTSLLKPSTSSLSKSLVAYLAHASHRRIVLWAQHRRPARPTLLVASHFADLCITIGPPGTSP